MLKTFYLQVLFVQTLSVISPTSADGFHSLPRGSYCSSLRNSCCDGRIDTCSVPVEHTRCYCDTFCNRTRDDCCPDYFSHCLNIQLPTPSPNLRCFAGDRYYNYGQEVKRNCNKCICQSGGLLECERNECLLEQNIINSVNGNPILGWRASNYSQFWGRTLQDGITFRTGTLQPQKTVMKMEPIMFPAIEQLPINFDSRVKWPEIIAEAIDQGWCGSSWAVSTAGVAGDRFGIMEMDHTPVRLSAQHLLSCNKRGQQGCKGGHLSRAWMFIRKLGIVNDECEPWANGVDKTCRFPRKFIFHSKCNPIKNQPFRIEPYKVGPAYRIQGERDIMQEIMTSGPVQATMQVYQDFFAYKSGIYRKSRSGNNDLYGYHSVRIIGWGEEYVNGRLVKYWLAVNSWGPHWGENGLFRIVRGVDECMIEEYILAAWTKQIKLMTDADKLSNRESNNI